MPELSMPLSKNFTLGELLRSSVAERDDRLKQEQENPPPEIIDDLKYLVETALQPIRDRFGYPIRVSSGYRCPLVNKLVGGSATSQHCRGEAADCELSPLFLMEPETIETRNEIKARIQEKTHKPLREDVDQNFYLFAHICLNLDELYVDQIIHEYGDGFGRPAWIHISTSRRQDKRQILFIGRYTSGRYISRPVDEALGYGTAIT